MLKRADIENIKFGVKIETINLSRPEAARVIANVVGGTACFISRSYDTYGATAPDGRVWKCVSDSSIKSSDGYINSNGELRPGNGSVAEIVTPILTLADMDLLQNIIRALFKAGARVNKSCGIHIHVDGSRFDGNSLANLVKLIYKQEQIMYASLQTQEARLGWYTRPIEKDVVDRIEAKKPKTVQDINEAWYGRYTPNPDHYHDSRYHSVNLNSFFYRGTIEIRAFEATLHAGKVKAYIHLVLALAARALTIKKANAKRQQLDPNAAKFQFRVFLRNIGLIGPEYENTRMHLLSHLSGNSAYRHGAPARRSRVAQDDNLTATDNR